MLIPKLRTYQEVLREEARQAMRRGEKTVLIQAPTGSGKTILVAHMLKTAEQKGLAAFFIVHRRELIKQSIKAFSEVKVKHGIIANGFMEEKYLPIQIASIQTLVRRHKKFKAPSLIIYDEAHHASAGSWNKIYNAYPDAYSIGLTATPSRLDGTGLKKWFSCLVNGPSVRWLIDNGFLADYKMYAPSKLNLSKVHTRMGDYVKSEISSLMDRPTITGDAIKHYKKLCPGKRAVVFCSSIKHSEHVIAQFLKAGIPAEHVDGETKKEKRDEAIRRFTDGTTRILSNVELFGEGFDLPAIEAAILLRPTQSLGLYLQQCGRALRPFEGKRYCVILDHAGNCERHGLPDDEREWTLEGRKGNKKENQATIKINTCPKCYAVQAPGKLSCNFCGFVFEVKSREINEVEGELVEIDPAVLRRKRLTEQSKAKTFEALVALGREKKYKRPYLWAKHIMRAREAKKMASAF